MILNLEVKTKAQFDMLMEALTQYEENQEDYAAWLQPEHDGAEHIADVRAKLDACNGYQEQLSRIVAQLAEVPDVSK